MPRHVVFLGPDLFSAYLEMVRGLKRAGARVTAIGHTSRGRLDRRLLRYVDDYIRIASLLDAGKVLQIVREIDRRVPVDQIETGDENLVLTCAQVREILEVPGLSIRSAQLCRDKPAMKDALRSAGVPTAASAAVDSLQALHEFAEREGFPLILKPRSALGSLGTHRVENTSELEAAGRALHVNRGKSAAVEEFVEGHEGFYDTLTVEGEPVHDFISHYYPNVLGALRDRKVSPQIAVTNRIDRDSYEELQEMGRKVIQTLGISTSATHMEWFFGPKGLKFSEIAARPPGERIWDLYSAANEMDVWTEWAMVMVHHRAAGRPSRRFATGSVQVRPDRDGRILGYSRVAEVWRTIRPWVFEHRLPPQGTPTDPVHKGYYNNVWFRLRHPDYDSLRELMSYVGATLRVHAG
ncbi:MAG: ATP-grasp domain-containing protein [Thermoanaerobaculia bacterium]|nr:ATP-grasp domain-containing protein [Thermoanaerobaculia bacterium]